METMKVELSEEEIRMLIHWWMIMVLAGSSLPKDYELAKKLANYNDQIVKEKEEKHGKPETSY